MGESFLRPLGVLEFKFIILFFFLDVFDSVLMIESKFYINSSAYI